VIDELLQSVAQLRSDGQSFRRDALNATDNAEGERLFKSAADTYQKAISILERGLRTIRRHQDGYTNDVCRLLEPLSQTYGSLGGTWRDAKRFDLAQEFYDRGNDYEEERRKYCGAKESYNLLQRLIVRLLEDPGRVHEHDFITKLNLVREEIQRQVDHGRDDSWALADLAEARFLCGYDADEAIRDLEQRPAAATFFESAYKGITALLSEGLGRGDVLGERLELFKRLLQRKGGIKS